MTSPRSEGPMRPLRPALLALALAILNSCGDSTEPIDADAVHVQVGDNFFVSNHIQVFPDQQVVWTWTGQHEHHIVFDAPGIADSPTQSSGQITRRFSGQTGDVLTYYCSIHGRSVMSGIIAIR